MVKKSAEYRVASGRYMRLKVHYDAEADVLYLAKEGQDEEVVEVYPGMNLELDANRELIGVELLQASELLKEVLGPLLKKATHS